jgi:hypothetical protein
MYVCINYGTCPLYRVICARWSFVVVEEFGGQAKRFFFHMGRKLGHKWASWPGMFRSIMVFMICTIGTIVDLQEGHADFTTSGMGMWIWNKPFRLRYAWNLGTGHLPTGIIGPLFCRRYVPNDFLIFFFFNLLVSLHANGGRRRRCLWLMNAYSVQERCIQIQRRRRKTLQYFMEYVIVMCRRHSHNINLTLVMIIALNKAYHSHVMFLKYY